MYKIYFFQKLNQVFSEWPENETMAVEKILRYIKFGMFIFFSQPLAGLTNQPPVRDSDPGTPLTNKLTMSKYSNMTSSALVLSRAPLR